MASPAIHSAAQAHPNTGGRLMLPPKLIPRLLPPFGPSLRKWALAFFLAMSLLATAMPGSARADDDEPFIYDARVQGYAKVVQLPSDSTALTWLLLIVLAGACIGAMFMDAKRSHLD